MSAIPTTENFSSRSRLRPWNTRLTESAGFPQRESCRIIESGLDSVFAARKEACWTDIAGEPSVLTTARVLINMREVQLKFLSHSRGQQIQESLDWLGGMQRHGCWQNDCLTTALVVIALQSHGRSIPAAALDFLQACRLPDGSFISSPEQTGAANALDKLLLTVTACRAVESMDHATEDFLAKHLHLAIPVQGACNASRFNVSAEILDWPYGLASISLLGRVSQITALAEGEGAFEKALVLRSLLVLRVSLAWAVAAALREMQARDGSWLGSLPFENPVVVTAVAVSALAMAETQPGLYFGSDRPLPRRY